MLKLVGYLHTLALYPAARVIVTAQSVRTWARTLGQAPVVHHETAHDGRPILLLALYEKGRLRPDVIRLLRTAREQGLYILAVNTLRLKDPATTRDLIDCYIERPNHGLDFGSYRTGFLHLFARGWHQTCPRLLMLNDSIYFAADRMPAVLRDRMASDVEALGGTENFEEDDALIDVALARARTSDMTGWRRISPENIRIALQERFYAPVNMLSKQAERRDIQMEAALEDLNRRAFVKDRETLIAYLRRNVDDAAKVDEGILMEAIRAELGHAFLSGSQIHQNAAILLPLGLPLVKLDGLCRGMFNLFDIRNITRVLRPEKQDELTQLLVERPYGNDTLVGWRRAAFNRGLI